MSDVITPPQSYEELRGLILARHEALSKRLRQIAEYALANPNDMALETVAEIAERADVKPSSLVRFAKALGYDGFSALQRVFRSRLTDLQPSYEDRIKQLRQQSPNSTAPVAVLDSFADAAIHAIEHMREQTRPEKLDRAISLLAGAAEIRIVGQRRSFPVAAYLAYALSQLERRVTLMDSVGGMLAEQARATSAKDVLVAVSYHPYAPETVAVVKQARAANASIVSLTDGPLSPLVSLSDVCLEVEEAQVDSFRALSASMCLTLSLVVALGHRLEAG